MTKRDLGIVGTSRDASAMLEAIDHAARHLGEAVELDLLTRTKVTGRWMYAVSKEAIEAATDAVESAVTKQLEAWLIGGIPYLRGPISRAVTTPAVTSGAVELLIYSLVRSERIGVLPLMTNDYEPYLGLYAPDDEVEVERQIETMKSRLATYGHVSGKDLSEPTRPREGKAWRSTVVRYGEYLGLGRLDEGTLIAWDFANGT